MGVTATLHVVDNKCEHKVANVQGSPPLLEKRVGVGSFANLHIGIERRAGQDVPNAQRARGGSHLGLALRYCTICLTRFASKKK